MRLYWDSPLPASNRHHWERLFEELPLLEGLRMTRWLGSGHADSCVEIHGFTDASERGYAAVLYLRLERGAKVTVHLLSAKSKVAPVKPVSLPRLELCAAALLTRLACHVRSVLDLLSVPVMLWSDSRVTLHSRSRLTVDNVANRVSFIQGLLPEAQWNHVPGRDNPADYASRGISPGELLHHALWWTGPPWLGREASAWPTTLPDVPPDKLPEQRSRMAYSVTTAPVEPELLCRFSALNRLLRVTAWCLRWRHPRQSEMREPVLSSPEVDDALLRWIRVVQMLHYPAEVTAVHRSSPVPRGSTLLALSPFMDEHGTLRVGGRLRRAKLSHDERHPIIVPPRSHLTQLLIESYHRRALHGGAQLTLGMLRPRYWIPRARTIVKQWLHRCVICARWRAITPQPPMGELPKERVTPARPFLRTGVDYAGPVLLQTSKGRGHHATKAFIAIFVYLCTKAVHLKAASDYSTEAFLAAFRRFITRRSLCAKVFSDCGTNFAGADRQLRDLLRATSAEGRQIADAVTTEGVR